MQDAVLHVALRASRRSAARAARRAAGTRGGAGAASRRGVTTTPAKCVSCDSICAAALTSGCGGRRQLAFEPVDLLLLERLDDDQAVDEEPVALGRRHAAGRGVRARDEAHLLEVGHHVADRSPATARAPTGATASASRPAGPRRCSARRASSAGGRRADRSRGASFEAASILTPRARAPHRASRASAERSSEARRTLWNNRRHARHPRPLPPRRDRRASRHARPRRAARRLAGFLASRGPRGRARGGHRARRRRSTATTSADAEALGARADLAIVLGGDGTMLVDRAPARAARRPADRRQPGRLGFLTDIPLAEMERTLEPMLAGRYLEERRTMLATTVERERRRCTRPSSRSTTSPSTAAAAAA